jgi:hypothetical protein
MLANIQSGMNRNEKAREERKTVTLRLSPKQHKRLRAFSVEVESSIQDLLVLGLSRLMVDHGLAPLEDKRK